MDWISCELDRLFGDDWKRDPPNSGQPIQGGIASDRSPSVPSSASAALTCSPRTTADSRLQNSASEVSAMTSAEFGGGWMQAYSPFGFAPSATAAVRFYNQEVGTSSGFSTHLDAVRLQPEAAASSPSPASASPPSDCHSPAVSPASVFWSSLAPQSELSSPPRSASTLQSGPRALRGSGGALSGEQGGPPPRLLPLADTTGSSLLDRRRHRHRPPGPGGAGAGLAAQEAAPSRPRTQQSCAFCHKNGESRKVVASHRLRDSAGRVACPVLRQHVCEVCHGTGDTAHTRTYCPLLTRGGCQRPPASATVQLKSTRLNAAGKRRF